MDGVGQKLRRLSGGAWGDLLSEGPLHESGGRRVDFFQLFVHALFSLDSAVDCVYVYAVL